MFEAVFEAAYGLSLGTDWNHGTQAEKYGYRRKLIGDVEMVRQWRGLSEKEG